MHASRKLVQLTTAAIGLLLAACGNSTASGSDAGCASQACTESPECPAITCTCSTGVSVVDGGSEMTGTRTITGECTSGCCAGCPAGCQ